MPTVKNYQKSVDKQKQAYDYFISQGYSPEASSGIVGNLVHESGLNTSIEGDKGYSGGSSFGLAQWRGARLKNLKQKYGDKWTDFGNQLEYVKYELENTHQKANEALKNTRDVFQAGQAFSDLYEIPAKKYGQNKDRQSKVNNVYNLFSGQPITEDFTDYVVPEKINSFAEAAPTQLESLPEEPKIDSKAAEEIKTQTNEYNFLKDLEAFKSKPVTANTIPLEQVQQLAPTNYLEKYNEISNFIASPLMQQGGTVPTSLNGMYEFPRQTVKVPTKDGRITMKNIPHSILGVDELGNHKLMLPNKEYKFAGKTVMEYPVPNLKNFFS